MSIKNSFLAVLICFSTLGFGQTNDSKWHFGSTVSGGYAICSDGLANDYNNFGTCAWGLDFYYHRLQVSPYCLAGWSTLKSDGSKTNLFDFGLCAGYKVVDRKILQVTPLLGVGVLSFGHSPDLKNIPTPSAGVSFDFKLWNNEKSKRKDVWMLRLRYDCSLPLNNGYIGAIHSLTLGVAVKGILF